MTSTTIFIIVLLAVASLLVVSNYLRKRHLHYNPTDLKKNIAVVFWTAGEEQIPRGEFLVKLKNKYGCTQKDANYLMGQARNAGFIVVENGLVRKGS